MEVVKSLLKPKPTPRQQLHEWQRHLRNEGRNIEHQIRDVQKEEKKVEKAIRDAAKALPRSSTRTRPGSTPSPCSSARSSDVATDGLNSKIHMKILLKWMWGRRIIKLSCTQRGAALRLASPRTSDVVSKTRGMGAGRKLKTHRRNQSDALDFIHAAEDKGFMAKQGAWCSQATNGGCSTSSTQTTIELQVYEI
ncbi:uncharacterized protein LOC125551386 isoform X4 [Triticum urartu]|uniref:uncharacterized protein LOC125551386 isoform X4 n=1 Tax=Triticum urartu TaxID=4572 RepID=UPI00204481F4|nr:uncharacterized protein LOC125551386 isoform X4 [Triticum urartu]